MTKRLASAPRRITPADYKALAHFRFALRHFLHFSAEAARAAGLSPQQHQALLAIKGFDPAETVSIGHLATRLHLKHHSTVGLIDRLAKAKLVRRVADPADKRRVQIELTAQGEALIAQLSTAHRDELRRLGPELQRLLQVLDAE
ncbi:MAG: MarR family transcriptional regulator [Verrucomicrobia bacterium]|nr:MarR family transcriptional regulator [Verrucomicrobiota bacterium]